jgi:hypothetical protein
MHRRWLNKTKHKQDKIYFPLKEQLTCPDLSTNCDSIVLLKIGPAFLKLSVFPSSQILLPLILVLNVATVLLDTASHWYRHSYIQAKLDCTWLC